MSWIFVALDAIFESFPSTSTLVNFLPSGNQKKFILTTFDGKKRFSINFLSVAFASTNQTAPPNSDSSFFESSGFDLKKTISEPLKKRIESTPNLAALIKDNVLTPSSRSASLVNFIAISISVGVSRPDSSLASQPAQSTPVLASNEQIGVFKYYPFSKLIIRHVNYLFIIEQYYSWSFPSR